MNFRQGANRRKLSRLSVELKVTMRVHSALPWSARVIAGSAVDYNRYGLGLVCSSNVRAKSRVTLDISAGHMVLRSVRAQVVSSARQGKEYRIGLRFYRKLSDFADPGPGHPLHFLLGLEETLEQPV
ncbi:MAG: hypothetical protein P1U67_03380 [Alcanivoracaceae bacterium]|nr:hypothetical protein [Alcanivoracaceae bacterium]